MRNLIIVGYIGVLSGCVTPTTPYTAESRVSPLSSHWASSGGSGTKRLVVHNPMSRTVEVKVYCEASNIFEGESEYWFNVDPDSEKVALISVPQKYMVGDACTVSEWNYLVK